MSEDKHNVRLPLGQRELSDWLGCWWVIVCARRKIAVVTILVSVAWVAAWAAMQPVVYRATVGIFDPTFCEHGIVRPEFVNPHGMMNTNRCARCWERSFIAHYELTNRSRFPGLLFLPDLPF